MPVTYNGFEFTKYASITMRMENVYDAAHVTVIGHRFKMTVRDFLLRGDTDGEECPDTVDVHAEFVRGKLMEKRKPLEITEIGFGDIDLSNPDEEIDNGPRPLDFEWQPVGHNKAAAFTWSIEFTTSPCEDGTYEGLSSLVNSVQHSINEKGYASIAYSVLIEVAAASRSNIDSYRDKFQVPIRPGCHRHQQYTISEDRRRLNLTITDREIESPNAYPAGVISINSPTTLSVRLPSQNLATSARVQISANMELRGTESRLRAWVIWNSILATRLGRIALATNNYILRDMVVTEDWYTHHYSFSCTVTHFQQNLTQHLSNFSFFAAVNQDWSLWTTSMQDAYRKRGLSQLGFLFHAESRNLCTQDAVQVTIGDGVPFPPLDALISLCNPTPTPERSWIDFDAELIEAPEIKGVAYTTYGETEISQNTFNPASPTATKPTFDFKPVGTGYSVKYAQAPSIQRYIWRGTAMRIGYPIPPPTKVTLNGVPMRVAGEPRVINDLIGYQYCQPVYRAVWSIGLIYDQPESPVEREETDPSGLKYEGSVVPS